MATEGSGSNQRWLMGQSCACARAGGGRTGRCLVPPVQLRAGGHPGLQAPKGKFNQTSTGTCMHADKGMFNQTSTGTCMHADAPGRSAARARARAPTRDAGRLAMRFVRVNQWSLANVGMHGMPTQRLAAHVLPFKRDTAAAQAGLAALVSVLGCILRFWHDCVRYS